MVDLEDKVSELRRTVAVLEAEAHARNAVAEGLMDQVDRWRDLTESLHRLLTVHDERIKVNAAIAETVKEEMNKDIRELENRVTRETQHLSQKIDQSEHRILEKIAELQRNWEQDQIVKYETKTSHKDKLTELLVKFESWKYFLIGGIFAAGILLGKSGFLGSILTMFK